MEYELQALDEYRYLIPRRGAMRVPGLIYAPAGAIAGIAGDGSPGQVADVACLPGITGYSLAMPDIHQGYGAPIGAVAAFDLETGVAVPGITGYDINCGVRLLRTGLEPDDIRPRLETLLDEFYRAIPCGVGATGRLKFARKQLDEVLLGGAAWAVRNGFGAGEDLPVLEEGGHCRAAAPERVSDFAARRGAGQLGTLGSGNHFLEVQVVRRIFDERTARQFGLFKNQVTLMLHTGSRGLGHQVCADYLARFERAQGKFGGAPPDRQLVYAPLGSEEADAYLGAMAAAANFGFANRQVIACRAGELLARVLGRSADDLGLATVYDVAHNIARVEEHLVEGKRKKLLVHRKGATRCFPAGRIEIPARYAGFGHPVLLPGTMGTASYVMVGTEKALNETWGSTAHGAGRAMSRHGALKALRGRSVVEELAARGVIARAPSLRGLAEEHPDAYKDIDQVVAAVDGSGLARPVAMMVPVAVIKG